MREEAEVTVTTVADRIAEWIGQQARAMGGPVTRESRLLEENILDSLQFLHLVGFLEVEYGVAFDVDDLTPENFETSMALAAVVGRLRERRGREEERK